MISLKVQSHKIMFSRKVVTMDVKIFKIGVVYTNNINSILKLYVFNNLYCCFGRLLTNRGPDRSGSSQISIWQLPDQSGSCLILQWWLPDWSGHGLILIMQKPDGSGICLIFIRQQPDRSGPGMILIRQLPDRSGSRLMFILSDFLWSYL